MSETPKTYADDTVRASEDVAIVQPEAVELAEVLDHEELSRQALQKAFKGFIKRNGSSLELDNKLKIDRNFGLLDRLDDSEEFESELPEMTVCAPVAILQEDLTSLVDLVGMVRDSAQTLGKPVELVLWANARFSDAAQEDEVNQAANERYLQLRDMLREADTTGLQLRTAFEVNDSEYGSISQMRSNYMDAVAKEGATRGYGFEHPVLWLDADTTFIDSNALAELNQAARSMDTLTVHTNTWFTADWAAGQQPSEYDQATKAVVANELYRRQKRRQVGYDADTGEYYEECGFTIPLGVYLVVGGVNTNDRMNESAWLVNNLTHYVASGWPIVPDFFNQDYTQKYVNDEPSFDPYIQKARIGMSARRHYELAQRYGVGALEDPDTDGYGGVLYSEMSKNGEALDVAAISKHDLHNLLDLKDQHRPETGGVRDNLLLNTVYRGVVERLIDKYGDELVIDADTRLTK